MFIKTIRKSRLTTIVLLFICLFGGWILLKLPEATSSGINRGLSICTEILIPSLFPFLVLSSFMVKTGVSESVGVRMEKPMRFLFGLPGSCATGIFVGFIGGYPAGSIVVNELLNKGAITKSEARHMLCFCVNGGPAFIISAVGAKIMGNVAYGVALYVAHVIASIIIGLFFRPAKEDIEKNVQNFKKAKAVNKPEENPSANYRSKKMSPSTAFVDAVYDSCRSMALMCGFLILFAALLSIIDGAGITYGLNRFSSSFFGGKSDENLFSAILSIIIPSILEVSCGSIEAGSLGMFAPLLLGMTLGWGGFSVHFQIAAVLRGKNIVGKRFFFCRFIHAILGGFLSALIFRFVPIPLATSGGNIAIIPHSTTAFGSAALLFVCAIFIVSFINRRDENE